MGSSATGESIWNDMQERGVEFVFAQFVDMYGRPSAKLVPVGSRESFDGLVEERHPREALLRHGRPDAPVRAPDDGVTATPTPIGSPYERRRRASWQASSFEIGTPYRYARSQPAHRLRTVRRDQHR